MAFLFVNVVELVYYIFCIFPRVDTCLWFDIENNFLYNLLAYSCQFRLAMVFGSAAWFIFKICLVVFEGNMLLSWLYSINSVIEFKSLCISFVLHCDLRLNGFVRFRVLFLYIFSYDISILFFIEFIIVVCLVSRDQEVVVVFDLYKIYIYKIKLGRNHKVE